ncbi:BgTH12-07610 [Blumeria graminis f. sp. triticale]|uniref:Bgt-4616 n=3 Tax=Blumeria graminis TaxID=34373 RepID=A0A381LBV1_BLUGR|nr:Peptidase [Blumeria graminis f. sp. tritici 96224]CAD6500433.1 BgTH12-07610 [Blumeria graminis f. sp. triticale]VCU40700.1 Bgt-4616 [Blumeria graminis f. sp. tritici]
MKIKNVITYATLFSSACSRVSLPIIPRLRNSTPSNRLDSSIVEVLNGNSSHSTLSSNWAGAILTTPPAGSTFTAVSARFTIPAPKVNGAASAWVGIDGDTYAAAILQTGIDFMVINGVLAYKAWYEWYPDYAYDFTDFKMSPGDVINISVAASSSSAGTAIIENVTTRQKVTKALTAPTSNSNLAGQNAEWIIEDFQQDGALVPLTNFGTVSFTNSMATTSAGKQVDTTGAQILDIQQGRNVLTSSSASGSTVTVSHK